MYCVVQNCKTFWIPNSTIKFHSFPKDEKKRNLWLSIIPLKGTFSSSSKICSCHFKIEDYNPDRPGHLLQDAVPFYSPDSCDCHPTSTELRSIAPTTSAVETNIEQTTLTDTSAVETNVEQKTLTDTSVVETNIEQTTLADIIITPSRPTLRQVRALVEYIEKHPDLAHRKLRNGMSRTKVKKLWTQWAKIGNGMHGAIKTTLGWIKFWSDKRRNIMMKQKQIEEGTVNHSLSQIEQKIRDLVCQDVPPATKRKKTIKTEPFTGGEDDSMEELFPEPEALGLGAMDSSRLIPTEAEERQLGMMEKLVEVMDQQAQAMSQVAQATHSNSKALERLAEASHMQALAVDRLAGSFENITAAVHDIRNAIVSVDYTMKSYYSTSATQRQANIFS